MNPPLVSILIPAWNASTWIAETLESALAQTHPRIEIIVIDDGSSDDTAAKTRSYRSKGVRLVTQANSGASAARNHALRLATGDYIQFLDADDLLSPDKIALQIATLISSPPLAIASGPWGVFTDNPSDTRFLTEPVWADFAPIKWLICSWTGGGMMHPAAWLVPRAVVEAAGPWDESLSLDDDGEYFTRILLSSSGVRFVADARSHYRNHSGPRLSRSRDLRAARSSFAASDYKQRHLLAAENSAQVRRALACNYRAFAWDQLAVAPDLAAEATRRWHSLDPDLRPIRGNRLHRALAPILGWRIARIIELGLRKKLSR